MPEYNTTYNNWTWITTIPVAGSTLTITVRAFEEPAIVTFAGEQIPIS